MHLGFGDWVIVDSCFEDEEEETPVSLGYLNRLGVDPAKNVELVVVTHWHDDHIGGIAKVIRTCRKASVGISAAFTRHDFISGVHVVEPSSMIKRSGVREFWEVWKHFEDLKRPPTHASVDKLLWHRRGDVPVRVVALSPSNEDVFRGIQQLRTFILDALGETLEYVPPLKPNEASAVVWVTVGDTHLLLGADLERPGSTSRGWLAVLDHAGEWEGKRAEVFKIPHHGSVGAYEPRVWAEMLTGDGPIGLVTPFIKGSTKLPTPEQRGKLLGHSARTYISSEGDSPSKLSDAARQTLRETTTSYVPLDLPMGQIRLRKRLGDDAGGWRIEVFPPAALLAA